MPEADPLTFYEPCVEQISRAGVAVEVSTAGLRKPVAEIYPAPDLLQLFVGAGCPVSLSSDAHEPENVGFEYDRVVPFLRDAGVEEICVFDQRQRRMEPLG
jgi:histidinol-phosphatase (PHP family)